MLHTIAKMCSNTTPTFLTIAIQEPNSAGFSFRTFDTYPAFHSWHTTTPDSSHYEVIQGKQNLYFDFDGDLDAQKLTDSIRQYYTNLEKTANRSLPIRIDIYSSSDSVKKSFHVVVKGVCFRDHLSCGQAAREIAAMAAISSFDSSVYTTKRNLRLLGSRKLNSTRVKVFSGTSYRSSEFVSRFENDQLFLSLITMTSECQLVLLPGEQSSVRASVDGPSGRPALSDFPPEMVRDALQLVNDLLPGVFSQREVRGRTLFLRRNKPAICPVCERLHESDNAMVSLRGGRGDQVLHFVCMRDTSRSLPLQSDEEVVLPLVGPASVSRVGVVSMCDPKTVIELYAEKLVKRWGFPV